MSLRALVYAYILGGLTFIPLLFIAAIFFTIYTSVPVAEPDSGKQRLRGSVLDDRDHGEKKDVAGDITGRSTSSSSTSSLSLAVDDLPKTRKGWLTVRRTYEEATTNESYVMLVRSFIDARSKDPKKSRPKDMWYAVLKGTVMFLYEDEGMTECEAAIEVAGHDVLIYPEGLQDGELFARRNAICLRPRLASSSSTTGDGKGMPSLTREMKYEDETLEQLEAELEASGGGTSKKKGKDREKEREKLVEAVKKRKAAREAALASTTPWFLFVRSNVEMEDWYLSLVHASDHPANTPTLSPLHAVFQAVDMHHLLMTLDEQPDVVPMRWLNALMGRVFFSYYKTRSLEDDIIRRLMKKLSKVKRPAFLSDVVVTEVSVGNKAPFFSKPMLKELTKEGDASLQVHLHYKGEFRITVAATATINLGARFKSYVVKLTLAAVLRELEGNLLIKVKRPPSSRIWYAFTQTPKMVLDVEPIVSDRQITWGMILHSIEAKLMEIIQESVVMPNMDDISFFDSLPFKHRGGIWPEASRSEKKAAPPSDPPAAPAVPPLTSSNTASASTPALDEVLARPSEPKPSPLKHARSAEDLKKDATSTQPFPVVSRSSMDSTLEDATKNSSRRSSMLQSVASSDSGSLLQVPSIDDDEQYGRAAASSSHSRSAPRKRRTSRVDPDVAKEGEEPRPRRLSNLLRRSPSQQSSLRESEQKSSSSSSSSLNHTPSVSSKPSSRLAPPTTPTSVSFFSTLKARANDKQTLSSSAKEAMRKWGVNWGGGQKKDASVSESDDNSDQGSIDSRRRVDSDNGVSFAQRARASYAEVRAAVAEMRGKDKVEAGRMSPKIPATWKAKTPSIGDNQPDYADRPGTPIPVTQSPKSSLDLTSSTPPKARTSSLSQTIMNSVPDKQDILPIVNEPGPSVQPIHTQPMQAKTMSIPGIHVSHRGDVMSIGSVAPAPAPAPTPAPVTDNRTVTLAAKTTIQSTSVYRLWKSPVLSGQQSQGADEFTPTSQAQSKDSIDSNKDVTPLSLTPSAPTTPPRPPPLPPRSTSTAVSRAIPDPQLSPETREWVPGMSASEALKFIASKDENKRASLERSPILSESRPSPVDEPVTPGVNGDGTIPSLSIISPPLTPRAGPPLPDRRVSSRSSSHGSPA